MAVMKRFESVAAHDLFLQLLDLFVVKLDQRAAAGADQVVVVRVLVVVLVQHAPVVEFKLASQATLLKKLQCAIYGCEPDRRILCFDDRVQILAGDVPFGIQKHIEDQIALGRSLEPRALEMLLENLLLFTFHNGPAGIDKIIHARIELAKRTVFSAVRGGTDQETSPAVLA